MIADAAAPTAPLVNASATDCGVELRLPAPVDTSRWAGSMAIA